MPVSGDADGVPVAGQADPGGEIAGVVLGRPDAVRGNLDRRQAEPLRVGGAVDVPVEPGMLHEDLQAAADEQDQEEEVHIMGDAEPGRKAVRRGGLGNRFGTGRDPGQTEYSPLQVGCSYRRDDHEDEQQESEALDSHETRSTEEGTAVGCRLGERAEELQPADFERRGLRQRTRQRAGQRRPQGADVDTPSSGSAAVDMNSSEQETLQRAAAWSCPLGEHDGQEHQGIFDPAQGMGIVAQQVEPVAGRQVVGYATDGEGGPPLQAMDRDRTLDLVVVADLAPLGGTSGWPQMYRSSPRGRPGFGE